MTHSRQHLVTRCQARTWQQRTEQRPPRTASSTLVVPPVRVINRGEEAAQEVTVVSRVAVGATGMAADTRAGPGRTEVGLDRTNRRTRGEYRRRSTIGDRVCGRRAIGRVPPRCG